MAVKPSSSPASLVFLLFLPLCLAGEYAPSGHGRYDAMFAFGNSFIDTGNAVIMTAAINFTFYPSFPPYGETFFHHPAGRLCDGRVIVDFLAEQFGLPLLPPYLATAPGNGSSLRRGADFAVGGASALSVEYINDNGLAPFKLLLNNTLSVQLGWFDQLKPSLCSSDQECKAFFRKAIFIFGEFGVNDYNFITSVKGIDGAKAYVPKVVALIRDGVQKLIDEGAGTVVVAGLPPSGCAPGVLTQFPGNASDYNPRTGCLDTINKLCIFHNTQLQQAVKQLRKKHHPQAKIIYADYYHPITNFVKYPKKFGFQSSSVLQACCGGGGKYNVNFTAVCGQPGVKACPDPSAYISWDGTHYTETAYRYIVNSWLNGPYAYPPILSGPR